MNSAIDWSVRRIEVKMYSNTHYEKYPNLKPWVGSKYGQSEVKKLLIIGESHYLPKGSVSALDAEQWYAGNQGSLTDKEKSWINTSGIIEHNIPKNFPKKSHWIYRNVAKEINKVFLGYENPANILDHVAFMNYFQRPAESEGGSINIKSLDLEVADRTVTDFIKTLTPDLVVFCSSKAGKYGALIVRRLGVECIVAPHPSSQWWNRIAKSYGGFGRDIIPNFLVKHQWAKSA